MVTILSSTRRGPTDCPGGLRPAVGSSGAGARLLSGSDRGSGRSFHRFEQHTEDIRGKNKGEMAFVEALEILSNEANADRISKIVEEDFAPYVLEPRVVVFVRRVEVIE